MLSNACFEVFHTDTGNDLRNTSYNNLLDVLSFLPRLDSPTVYLNTAKKVDEFKTANPQFKIHTVHDYCQPGETFPPSAGVVGVWASNYLAYKQFLETDKDVLLIFEDDIILSKNFKEVGTRYMEQLMPIWDFFSFFVPDDSLFAYNPAIHDIGEEEICISYQQWSCAGYAVSRRGAAKAVADIESKGITAPVDWYIFNFRMKAEKDQTKFSTFTVKPTTYKPIKFLQDAAQYSQIHNGSTELLK